MTTVHTIIIINSDPDHNIQILYALFCTVILLFIIVVILLPVVLYILFVPFRFNINTDEGFIKLNWGVAGSAGICLEDDIAESRIIYRIFFYKKEQLLLELATKEKKEKKLSKVRKKVKKKTSFKNVSNMILQSLRSFKINHLEMSIDTGDYCLNGILYPLCYALNIPRSYIGINFVGRNFLICEIQITGFRLTRSYIKSKFN